MNANKIKRRWSRSLLKAEISVLMLFCRRAIYGVLTVSLACCIVQGITFFVAMEKTSYAPEQVFAAGHAGIVGMLGFIALCAILAFYGSGASKQDYTLRRLSISPRRVLAMNAASNAMLIMIFWAMQALTLASLCQEFTVLHPDSSGGQAVFLAFYRDGFLHGCLPMADVGRWLRNITVLGALALSLSCFSARRRRGQAGLAAPVIMLANIFTFSTEMGSTGVDVAVILLVICVSGAALYGMWGGDDEEAEA